MAIHGLDDLNHRASARVKLDCHGEKALCVGKSQPEMVGYFA
jgi:hypothetical protein